MTLLSPKERSLSCYLGRNGDSRPVFIAVVSLLPRPYPVLLFYLQALLLPAVFRLHLPTSYLGPEGSNSIASKVTG